jgi:hypothetical protein
MIGTIKQCRFLWAESLIHDERIVVTIKNIIQALSAKNMESVPIVWLLAFGIDNCKFI